MNRLIKDIKENKSFTLKISLLYVYLEEQGNSYKITNHFLYYYLMNILDFYSVAYTNKTSYIYIRYENEYIKFTQPQLKILIKSFFPTEIYHDLVGIYNIIGLMKLENIITLEEFREKIEPCNSEKITFLIDYKKKIIH